MNVTIYPTILREMIHAAPYPPHEHHPCKCLMTSLHAGRRVMAVSGYFAGVSNIVQNLVAELFEDEAFIADFLAENTRRLGASYRTFTGWARRSAPE